MAIDGDEVIAAPTSLPEVGIHLSYLRRDIRNVGKIVEDGFKAMDGHYVSKEEFEPVKKDVYDNKKHISSLLLWKENMTGRWIGFATAISFASAAGTAGLVKLFGG